MREGVTCVEVGAITAASHGQQSSEADPVVTQNPNLRLPTLQLPTFRQDTTVQDDISYFLERFQEQTAHLTPPARQALLEQQCIGEWPRSVLSFCRSTEGFTAQTPSQQFDMYVKALREEFEEPKDSKCRRLASELSAMVQDPSESTDQFAFKYKNVLHKLDKLGEISVNLVPLTLPRNSFQSCSCTLLSTSFCRRIRLLVSIKPLKLLVELNNRSPLRLLHLSH